MLKTFDKNGVPYVTDTTRTDMFARQSTVCRCLARSYQTRPAKDDMLVLHGCARPTTIIGVEVAGTTVQPGDLNRIAHRRRLKCPTPDESLVVRDRKGMQSVVWLRYEDAEKAQQAHEGINQIILNGDRLRPTYSKRHNLPRSDILAATGPAARFARDEHDRSTGPAPIEGQAGGRAVSIEGLPPQTHQKVLSSFLRGYDLVEDQTQQLHEIYRNGERSSWLVRLKTNAEAERLARDANNSFQRMRKDQVGDYVLRAQVFT